jgi:signal transduction histidine kinase
MIVVALSVLVLTGVFLITLGFSIRHSQAEILRENAESIYTSMKTGRDYHPPYGLSWLVYDSFTRMVYTTNDPFLPTLPDTHGAVKQYFVNDYFSDGDLHLRYYAVDVFPFTIVTAIDLDSDFSVQTWVQLPRVFLIILAPILIISFFLSVLISRRTIRPVVEVTEAAQKISSSNLNLRLPLSGTGDEIDELAKTFNHLIEQLEKDFSRERQFASDVSHELKTPLAVILGQTNLLMRWGKDEPEQLEKSLLAIKKEGKSMQAVIENLLQISRYESGRLKPSFGKVHVKELFVRLQNEFSELEHSAAGEPGNGVEIKIECEEDFVIVSDEELLHQIFTVFISNSIKFALPDKPCQITLRAASKDNEKNAIAEHFILEESDNGPGIAEEALPHIFDRFYKGDDSHNRNAGGCGLGLSIAKTLATVLNCQISANTITASESGASFRIISSS